MRLPTSTARERLSSIITQVQDPRAFCVLTRHGKPVAAIVSMAELHRIFEQQEIEDIVQHGKRPAKFTYGKGMGAKTNREAAEEIQRLQMDRRMEREVLRKAGLKPVPGGELEMEAEPEAPVEMAPVGTRRRGFWGWLWKGGVVG